VGGLAAPVRSILTRGTRWFCIYDDCWVLNCPCQRAHWGSSGGVCGSSACLIPSVSGAGESFGRCSASGQIEEIGLGEINRATVIKIRKDSDLEPKPRRSPQPPSFITAGISRGRAFVPDGKGASPPRRSGARRQSGDRRNTDPVALLRPCLNRRPASAAASERSTPLVAFFLPRADGLRLSWIDTRCEPARRFGPQSREALRG
jgi:hypothetical protein